jgi:nicotinamide mononucleotide transporter PnuC
MQRLRYFSRFEWCLILFSYTTILTTFFIFDGEEYFNFISSLVGIAALIFSAKGNPLGPLFMIIFATAYGVISYSFDYYGEMITYLGMSLPMSVWAFIAWFRNPSDKGRSETRVGRVRAREWGLLLLLTLAVTLVFYFALRALDTPNLFFSTLSISTSFAASYLTARRSPYFALAYATNDVVLVVLWVLATLQDISYLSVTTCFVVFLLNDTYSFFNWRRMEKRQRA